MMLWYRLEQEQANHKFNKIQEQEDLASQEPYIQQVYASKMKIKEKYSHVNKVLVNSVIYKSQAMEAT